MIRVEFLPHRRTHVLKHVLGVGVMRQECQDVREDPALRPDKKLDERRSLRDVFVSLIDEADPAMLAVGSVLAVHTQPLCTISDFNDPDPFASVLTTCPDSRELRPDRSPESRD